MKLIPTIALVIVTLLFIGSSQKKESKVQFIEIGVNVTDTIKSTEFYTEIFGMKRLGN